MDRGTQPCWGLFHVLDGIRIQKVPNHFLIGGFVQAGLSLKEVKAGPAPRNCYLDFLF